VSLAPLYDLFFSWSGFYSLASRLQFDTEGKIREIEAFIHPVLNKRLEGGIENPDVDSVSLTDTFRIQRLPPSQNDMITWLWNGADENHRTLRDVVLRIVLLHVAAIETTSGVSLGLVTLHVSDLKFEASSKCSPLPRSAS